MTRLPSSRITLSILLLLLLTSGGVARTMAQTGEADLVVAGVESQAFPRVAVFTGVGDTQGPVEGLTVENFQITEGENAVPVGAVEVETSSLPNLRLVLALDVSGSPADLAAAQQAAKALVDTMGPGDRMAVMSFGDDVRLVYDFTNNTTELRTAIDSLTATGSLTSLNRALVEAVNLTEQLSMGRKGVVLIANRMDNSQPPVPIADSLRLAQSSNTPIYVIGFGPDAPASPPLGEALRSTGGQYTSVPNAQAIQASLSEVADLLRQGYRVTFVSGLAADNAEHDFLIRVTPPSGQEAQAEGRFQAVAGPVTVQISGLTTGQIASGLVSLTPQVKAPAPLASVTYLLDGQPLATVSEPPYTLEWDSATAEAGPHTLTVQATDSAGNRGEAEVSFTVETPVQVSLIPLPKPEVQIGDTIPLQANIQTSTPLVRVDFLLDGVILGSKTAPPYQFDLDSSRYTPGSHVISLRVEDSQGHISEDSLSLVFLAKPLPQPSWFERFVNNPTVRLITIMALALLIMAAIILIAFRLAKLIRKLQYQRSQKLYRLEILNGGNIASHYQLQARDTLGGLSFQFSLNGSRLPQYVPVQSMATPATGRMMPSQPADYTQGRQAQDTAFPAVSSPSSAQNKYSGASSSTSAQPSQARQALTKANRTQSTLRGCLYSIVNVLDSVASLLPNAMGAPIRRVTMQLTQGQMAVESAVRTPTQMAQTANYVRREVSDAVPTKAKEQGTRGTSRSDTTQMEGVQPVPAPPASSPSQPVPVTPISRPIQPEIQQRRTGYPKSTEIWSETPVIEPAASLLVDVLIIPANPYQRQSYPFTMLSKPVEQENTPLVNEQGIIEMPGISWFWRYVPIATVVLVSTLLLGGVAWLTLWRLNEMKLLETLALT